MCHFELKSLSTREKLSSLNPLYQIRPVTGGGGVVCTCLDNRSVNFFYFLKTSILQLGMVDHLKVRQKYHRIENHYFQFIHKI